MNAKHNSQRVSPVWLILFLPLVAVVAAVVLAVRAQERAAPAMTVVSPSAEFPRAIVETLPDGSGGKRLVIPSRPERIISLVLGVDEILADLVDHDRITALTYLAKGDSSNVRSKIDDIKQFIGSDIEQVIALEPDLCFLSAYSFKEKQQLLQEARIPTFKFHRYGTFEEVFDIIETVGYAVGEEQKAKLLVAQCRKRLAAVAEKLPPPAQRPRVLNYALGQWVSGLGTSYHHIIVAAGGRNAAAEADIAGFAQVGVETVVKLDPDYLVVPTGSKSMECKPRLLAMPALREVTAIRKKQFIELPVKYLDAVSHYIVDAVEETARQLYPDRFGDDGAPSQS